VGGKGKRLTERQKGEVYLLLIVQKLNKRKRKNPARIHTTRLKRKMTFVILNLWGGEGWPGPLSQEGHLCIIEAKGKEEKIRHGSMKKGGSSGIRPGSEGY